VRGVFDELVANLRLWRARPAEPPTPPGATLLDLGHDVIERRLVDNNFP
jgi:hypothetical protein